MLYLITIFISVPILSILEPKETGIRDGPNNLINETNKNTEIFQSIRYPLGGKASMGRWRACASLIQSTASITVI